MTTATGQTRLAAVIGWPVRHSLSPTIHNAGFVALGLDWVYLALPVRPGDAGAAVAGMGALGIDGLSVTMPHKQAVAAAVDATTAAASALGVVNCVFRDGGRLVGDNTDGTGLVRSLLVDDGVDIAGRRCVVVGAGGAARSVIHALGRSGAAEVLVVNRTHAKAEEAAALAGAAGSAGVIDDVATADLVVQATSVGMNEARSPIPMHLLGPEQIVVDLIYHPVETALLRDARRAGARAIGGIGMLVHQAAEQFRHWTGHDAPVTVMRDAVRAVVADQTSG